MVKKNQTKKSPVKKSTSVDLDSIFDKYFWLVIPVFAVIYFLSSKYSAGFYQDDEIGHYNNMREFWSDPSVILGNWPKPGYKLFMVVPSLLGYQAVIFCNSLIASLTVYFTYLLLKAYHIKYSFFGALILAFQPLFFDLSFRSYAEIFAGLLFVLMILSYKKEKYFLSGLICGYIFTVRQEVALIGIVMAILFYSKGKYSAILSLAVFPVIFNLMGYIKSGDLFYIFSEMNTLGAMDFGGANRGFFHYFKVYIFIIGPVCLALFLLGYFGFLSDTKKMKEHLYKYDLPYIVFTLVFSVQVMLMIKGVNPGTWRYMLSISPLAAFFATVGLNNLADIRFKKINYVITGIFLLIILAVLSKTTTGLDLTDVNDFGNFAVVSIVFLLTLILFSNDTRTYLNKLSVMLLILVAVYFFISFEPRKLSSENLAVKQIGEYLESSGLNDQKIYITSQTKSPIFLFSDFDEDKKKNFIHLNSENLSKAVKGDFVIWDSHYGYRPEYNNDVKFETIQQDTNNYKILNQITSSDKRYQAFIFEKIN